MNSSYGNKNCLEIYIFQLAQHFKPSHIGHFHVQDGQIAEAETAKGNARILSLGGRVVK